MHRYIEKVIGLDLVAKTPLGKAKAFIKFRTILKREIINAILIIIGVFSASFGLESFMLPNNFIDGGITGVSLLVRAISNWNLSLLIIVLNIPFIIMAYRQIGKNFVIKTALGIAGLALCVQFVHFPILTSDKLLVSVFGGLFLGAGIGLTMRGGGTMDGTEVMAIALSKNSSLSVGDIIMIVNIVIFSFAAWLLSFETALYSILAYFSAARTIDFIIEGIEEYMGVTIVSAKNKEIRDMIIHDMGRGVTVYKGERGYGKTGEKGEINIVYTVITRLEVAKLKTEIEKIDPAAFVVMNSIKDTKGGMIKKRMHH